MTIKRRRRFCANLCLLVTGTLLISLGITIFICSEELHDFLIHKALTFNEESLPFKVWRKNDPPLPIDMYVYNWTNYQDIKNRSVKPNFEAVGPYRFKEVKEKVNITFNHSNETVTYRQKKSYFLDADNPGRNLSDIINQVNVVPLTIGYKARYWGYFAKRSLSYSLSSISSLHMTTTVGEFLFDGYEEGILSVLSYFPIQVQDRFGIFYKRNGTAGLDGTYVMSTKSDTTFGQIMSWNYKQQTTNYNNTCNNIYGSAGEFYPINQKRTRIVFFSAELCRVAVLDYEKNVTIKGVHGYKYTAKNLFDNGTLRSENKCYCLDDCLPSGVLNVSNCRDGSPSFLSMPHFYSADPYYLDLIDGPKPTDEHEFYLIMEPKSGIIMEAAGRMQLNMWMQPVKHINLYENVPNMMVPLFYFDQVVELKDDLAVNLRLMQSIPEYFNYLVLILICLGCIMLLWSICSIYLCRDVKMKAAYQISENTRNIKEEMPLRTKERM